MDKLGRYFVRQPGDRNNAIESLMICLYFGIAYFEPYLNGVIGSNTKYFIIGLILIVCINHREFDIRAFHLCYLGWLGYSFVTLIWTRDTFVFHQDAISQIGMIAVLITLTAITINERTVDSIVITMWIGSFIIGFLSLFFSHPYHEVATSRQVLYLFGVESDPNNQAAFLLVGIAIATYYLIVRKEKRGYCIITIVLNTISVFMTGSRGGLIGVVCIALASISIVPTRVKVVDKFRIVFVVISSAILIYIISTRYVSEEINSRLFDFSTYGNGSNRIDIWTNGWELFTSGLNSIFGAGWGAYYGYNNVYSAMHNTFLAMLCDVGVIGFLLFFTPILKAIIINIKKKNYCPFFIIISGLVPSFFIDAISKRFFWNSVIFLFICLNNLEEYGTSSEDLDYQGKSNMIV